MPEIAEVETIKNDLINSCIAGHEIIKVQTFPSKILQGISSKQFCLRLESQTLLEIDRKGKYLIFVFQDFSLLIHLNMTGHIFIKDQEEKKQKHDHIIFTFDNGKKLIYFDPRRFGKFYVKSDLSFLDKLGPDILSNDFMFDNFYTRLKSKNKKIKTLLLEQQFIAGIGNIYADEVLFHSKIHPEKLSNNINKTQAHALYNSIKFIISKAVKNRGTSLGKSKSNFSSINQKFGLNQNHLLIHTKKVCPNCKNQVQRIKINQRTSHMCKKCQKI